MARKKGSKRKATEPVVLIARKDSKYANLSFACGLLSWVPLLNIVAIPAGIVFGIMGVWCAVKHPQTHDGMVRAVLGLVICGVWLLMTAYAMAVYGPAALLQR